MSTRKGKEINDMYLLQQSLIKVTIYSTIKI